MARTSLVLLTTRSPSPLSADLKLAGYKVTEALWADEILQLLKTEHVDVVVIEHGVDDPELAEVQLRLMTLRLQPQAAAKDVIWELSQLFLNDSGRTRISY
jgi:hypothetical protein